MGHRAWVLTATWLGAVTAGCGTGSEPAAGEVPVEDHEHQLIGAATFQGGRAVTRWVEHALQTVRDQNVGTPAAGRLYALVTTAMYDAVNGIDRARSVGRQPALVLPAGAPLLGRRDAAAAAAAHTVLVALAPGQSSKLDMALAADRSAFGDDGHVDAGLAWGALVGRAVLAARSSDGTQVAENMPAGSAPGAHRASFDARFRRMTPFGIADMAPYASPGPPPLDSEAYAVALNEVKVLGIQDGNAERNVISDFWLAEAGTGRETGTWLLAGLAIVRDRGTEPFISPTARLFALLGMGIADAVLVSWEDKAVHFWWRPQPAVREAGTDGNPLTEPDPSWTPRIGTPGASPEYTSGLSTFSGAASMLIERFYCAPGLDFCFETDLASAGPRCFDSPLAAAEEAGRSRIYQGIHFEYSNQDGRRAGRALATEIANRRLKRTGPLAWLPDCLP
jgi:hypothetical protein